MTLAQDFRYELLLKEHIREEVLYREGMTMGLDEDDTVIKRRIRQKFEYFLEGLSEQSNPSDEDLKEYIEQNAATFKEPATYSFRQVYINPQTHGTNTEAAIEVLKAKLTDQNMDASMMGDRTLLQHANGNMQTQQVNLAYGRMFMDQLSQQETAKWNGPLESTFGLHMVIVDEKTDEKLPALEDIRDEVMIEWENSVREEAREIYFSALESKYEIILPE